MTGIDETLLNSAKSHNTIIESNIKLNDLVKDFSSMVSSFSELGDKASTSLPLIEQRMDLIVSKTSDHIEESLDSISSIMISFQKNKKK